MTELWQNPLYPVEERLEMAEGAIAFRDKIISNLRGQIDSALPKGNVPTFRARHLSCKTKMGKIVLTVELDALESARSYTIRPVNPAVVRQQEAIREVVTKRPALQVEYGSMPETNGKTNWTAILHRGDIAEGFTIDRSEYPDRVRYEADRVRWLIGETEKKPFILDYDADKHSGYVERVATPKAPE